MSTTIVSTKLYIPSPRSQAVLRPRLIERLNEGLRLHRKLTTISASAGSGKTTLLSQWIGGCPQPVAWLSLEKEDREPSRFLAYLLAALQSIGVDIEERMVSTLHSPSPHPLPIEAIIMAMLNHITAKPDGVILVLDDYHVLDSKPIDRALGFLIEHMPPQMHMVIASRKDPDLPLARLRARNQLTEVRTPDLRFTSMETSEFMCHVMGLDLSGEDAALIASRTEGWIAGLQLAALSLQGHPDAAGFIRSFSGSHRNVLDYLIEEVLQQQPESVLDFLLRTSILDRLCGSLCEYVLQREDGGSPMAAVSGQETLEYLERANLFIVPLDNERRWYRYHHLFSDALRQRLARKGNDAADGKRIVEKLHRRASDWHERHDFGLEAFQHAVAAQDVDRAARLMEGEGMPLIFRGAIHPVLNWLDSLPKAELDARPALYVMHASALLMVGQMNGVERKLQAAEVHLPAEDDGNMRDLIGHIASIRATLAVSKHQPEVIMTESQRALEYLSPHNLPVRTASMWTLGYAYQLRGDRDAAGRAYEEAAAISQKIGHFMIAMMATLGLGLLQEADNQLYAAAVTYRRVLELAGDPPPPAACEAHLGLARICREWNDLDAAERHGLKALQLAAQFEQTDRAVACEVFFARLKLLRGEVSEAAAMLAKADRLARQQQFMSQLPFIAEAQVLVLLQQGNFNEASQLAQEHGLRLSQARVLLAKGDAGAALPIIEPLLAQMEAKEWADEHEQLKVMVVLALALHAQGDKLKAARIAANAVAKAEPGGFIRLFIDEGLPMQELLRAAAASQPIREAAGTQPMHDYLKKLLHAFEIDGPESADKSSPSQLQLAESLIEPLTRRELEVLRLIAQGLSNRQISEKLFVALSTVKGHNRIIFDKLQATRRTEAVARARELGLL
ncbi:LuxR C-terminal-related transcriptional regulator [Paenibacillus lautus]|uniref:LuxR family transcriptional regulator n=1 Tax=Paenibacillus lautus TaxID=1401 RepID=A0A385TE85_PAELA|nr:LuxR C-terminal-related transcriptional regulator [Paenibacillus lautus]AYB42900.1 LuxR family transcriptional regulator [Paenibacillus lautus]